MNDKVVFALPSLAHGGAQKVFLELVSYLSAQGNNVYLLSLDREGELLEQLPHGIQLVHFSAADNKGNVIFRRIKQWLKFRQWIKRNKVGVVYSTITGMNLFVLSCFFFSRNITIVIREASSLENIRRKFIYFIMYLIYRRANTIICTSEYVKEQFLKLTFCSEKLVVIPNPIDQERIIRLSNMNAKDLLSEFDGYTIVAVGRLIEAKGFDILIEAYKELILRLNCRLIIIGEGPERHNLERQIQALGEAADARLLGYRDNPYAFMALADLYVLSSRWEGYVNTVVEAMVLGIPIVATDCNSEPGKILRDELGQDLVANEDSSSLANAMEATLLSEEKPDYKKVLARHNMEFAGKQYMECCIEH